MTSNLTEGRLMDILNGARVSRRTIWRRCGGYEVHAGVWPVPGVGMVDMAIAITPDGRRGGFIICGDAAAAHLAGFDAGSVPELFECVRTVWPEVRELVRTTGREPIPDYIGPFEDGASAGMDADGVGLGPG